jgi:DNA-binding transcriptional regulator YdaS (Cro superfamily)
MTGFEQFLQSKPGRFLKRAEWADLIGITPSFIAHLASGARQPSLATAYKIEVETKGRVTMQSWLQPNKGVTLPSADAETATAS